MDDNSRCGCWIWVIIVWHTLYKPEIAARTIGTPISVMIQMMTFVDKPSSDVCSFQGSLLGEGENFWVCSLISRDRCFPFKSEGSPLGREDNLFVYSLIGTAVVRILDGTNLECWDNFLISSLVDTSVIHSFDDSILGGRDGFFVAGSKPLDAIVYTTVLLDVKVSKLVEGKVLIP